MALKKLRVSGGRFSISSAKAFLGYAFGLTEKPGPHAVLEVGSNTLRLLECFQEDKSLGLLGHHFKEIPPQNLAVPAQEEILRKEVKIFLGGIRLAARKVTLGFSSGLVLVRKVTVPEMPKEELPKALRWAVRTQLPFDAERASLVFEGGPAKDKKQEALLAVAEESSLVNWVLLLQERGLRVVEITSAPLSLLQWLRDSKTFPVDATALVDLGTFHTSLFVLGAGKVLFAREFPLGGEEVTGALTQFLSTEKGEIHLTSEEAERLKRTYGFPAEEIEGEKLTRLQMVSLMRPVLERLASELHRSLDYFRQESGLSVKRILLAGGACQLKELDRFLEGKLGLPAQRLSFSLGSFFPQGSPSEEVFINTMPVWATTLALATRRSCAPFDLLPIRFREKKSKQIERATVRLSSFTLFLCLLFFFFFQRAQIRVLEKEAQLVRVSRSKVEEIELLQAKIGGRRELNQQLLKSHPFFVGALKEISQSLSSNAVLDRLGYEPTEEALSLSGTIFAAEGKPTEGLLGELISRLEKSAFFKEVRLVSSERDATYGQDASNFNIQCVLVMP